MVNRELYKDKDWLYFQYHIKGLSQSKIGSVFDVSQTTIRYWMEKYDMKSRGPGGLLEPDFDMEQCIGLYKSGMGTRSIADEVDATRNTIRRWLEHYGVDRHPTGMRKVDKGVKSKICELYDDGNTQQEVSNLLDVDIDQVTVSRIIRNSNLETRNKAGFGQVCYSDNGLEVKSRLERLAANWLENNVDAFEYEPNINGADYIPDFICGNTIVEVLGIIDSEEYDKRREMKTKKYNELGYDVVSVESDYQSVEDTLSTELLNGGEK